MKFTARVTRDILRSESATIELEAVDEADAERRAMLAATKDGPEIRWDSDNIDEVQRVDFLSVEEISDGDEA
jgi:hypothetical protein